MENVMRIALFENGYKTPDNKQPDYKTGKNDRIIIDGKFYDVAIWKRTSMGGKNYLSLSITESASPVEDLPEGKPF